MAALEQAKRPVLLTGGGIILADMAAPLWDVVQKTQVPVITSLMGKGAVPDSYDAHLGMVGMHGSYAANMAVTKCDLLIAVGTRFDDRITGDVENFAPNAQIVHFDIDKVEINKIVHADISVNGDLRWSLPLFDEKVRQSGVDFAAQFADWRKEVLAMNEAHPFATRDLPDAVSPQKLFEAVNSRLGADDFVVTDVGQHQMWAAQFCDISKPRHFITSGGLGTMGYGLPAAMGAKLGCSGSTVVLFTGDGSIMMNCQEFATLHKYGVDVKVIVLHNSVLGMVNQWQRLFYGSIIPSRSSPTTRILRPYQEPWACRGGLSASLRNWPRAWTGSLPPKGRRCWTSTFQPMKTYIPWCRAASAWTKWS